MSVFNGEEWLTDSIQSVLNQTFSRFEFIIVNDGSTDNSDSIIRKFARNDNRILYFSKSNTGLTDSLNYGLRKASGLWIARIDADDLCVPTRLQEQILFVENNSDVVLLGSGLRLINQFGVCGKEHFYPPKNKQLVKRLLRKKAFFPHSSAFFNRELVMRCGGYRKRLRYSQDFDLWLRLAEFGKIACITKSLVNLRIHSTQLSNIENGNAQAIYSNMALVSYFLRKNGFEDPVCAKVSNEKFSIFKNFVNNEMIENSVYNYNKFIKQIKNNIRLKNFIPLIKLFFVFKHSFEFLTKYLHFRLLGDTFCYKTAVLWMSKL